MVGAACIGDAKIFSRNESLGEGAGCVLRMAHDGVDYEIPPG